MWPTALSSVQLGRGNWFDAFGSTQLTETSPPQSPNEPVSLQEVKDACRIIDHPTIADTERDRRLTSLIGAARAKAEHVQGRRLVQGQYDLVFDYWPERKIRLMPPLISVDLVQYTDKSNNTVALVQGTDFTVDRRKQPPMIVPRWDKWWPAFEVSETSSILIRYTCGYAPTDAFWTVGNGAAVKEGILKLVVFWWNNANAITRGIGEPKEFPYTITELLNMGAIDYLG